MCEPVRTNRILLISLILLDNEAIVLIMSASVRHIKIGCVRILGQCDVGQAVKNATCF